MLFKKLTQLATLLLLCRGSNALPNNHTDDLVNAAIDAGTFLDPSVKVRPRFRYWPPDASINLTRMADDIKGIGSIGGGGIELLGYYDYGGNPIINEGTYAPVDWSVYGWGTPAWVELLKTALQATADSGLQIDVAMGPNQGQGVPAEVNSHGLSMSLVGFNVTVPLNGTFNGTLPGWGSLDSAGNWTLQAVTIGLVTNSTNTSTTITTKTLAASSLKDITDQVQPDGTILYDFPDGNGIEYYLFAIYDIYTNYRAQASPLDMQGPQTAPQNFIQNGSFAVDHFSSAGAKVMTDFWENYMLNDTTVLSLLKEVGNYAWEDSVEIRASVFWTPDLLSNFLLKRGYAIQPYLPVLFQGNGGFSSPATQPYFITDDFDSGLEYRDDFRQTLAEGYHDYLSTLTSWANEFLDIQYSAQISYNMPMDMLENVPSVNAPECESLTFGWYGNDFDTYRQFVGPAHLAGKRIISNEMGALEFRAYSSYVPQILRLVKHAFASGVNQMVMHGAPYSGNYGNTTWPGFTTFKYDYSEMYSRHQPAWEFYSDAMDYIARCQLIMQTGVPKVDLAFWHLATAYGSMKASYADWDLYEAGYTYEYLSPNNLQLPNAVVRDNILAPDAQAFKALIIRANEQVISESIPKLWEFAQAGLPIIFSGGLPDLHTSFSGFNSTGDAYWNETLTNLLTLDNVYAVASTNFAETVASLGIIPSTKTSASSSWYTYWRNDPAAGADYVFVYYDGILGAAVFESQSIEFANTGYPYFFNAWTGVQTSVLNYTTSENSTTIPLTLAVNQSTIIAFFSQPLTNASIPDRTMNGTAGEAISLTNWTLTAEHWNPPDDLYDIETVAIKTNTTHELNSLISWQNITGLENVSGVGYYMTNFTLDTSYSGAVIDFGIIVHTIRVYINGQQIPPLDLSWAKADITEYLVNGKNTVEAVISTPLGNLLQTMWTKLETSGLTAHRDSSIPLIGDYGLIGNVTLTPFL